MATSQSTVTTERSKDSFKSLNGQGAFELHGHNLRRCDSFRLTIGSEGNKEVLSPQLRNVNPQKNNNFQEENKQTDLAAINSGI